MRISIAGKICFVLLMIFSSVLLGITTYQSRLEHDMMLQLSRNEAHHQMVEMLDKQSISRLTHQPMETQETRLREQTLITGQVIFHPGSSTPGTLGEVEQGAWHGKYMERQIEEGDETLLLLASPFYFNTAEMNYQLTPSKSEDQPTGIVRITYTLTPALAE